FEDWDFWLQLNQHTNFVHISNLSAFYREGGDSQTASDEDSDRYQNDNPRGQGRAKLFEKWLKLWNGDQLNSLLGFLDQTNSIIELNSTIENLNCTVVSSSEHNEQLVKHILAVESQSESLQSDIGAARTHSQQLAKHILAVESDIGAARIHSQQLLENLDAEKVALASLRNVNLEKTQQLESSVNHAAALDTALRSILGSTSWRIMGPYRRVGRLLKRFLGFGQIDTRATGSGLAQPSAQDDSISSEPETVYTHPLSFYVDKAITFDNCIYITGWATKAPGIEGIRLETHNSSASVSYGILREDIQQAFPLVPDSDKSGFLAFAKFDCVGKTYLEFTDSEGVVSRKPVVLEKFADASSLIESGEFINLSPDAQYTIFRALQQIKGLESIDSNKSFEYTPLISIIVPVFNVEKRWLDACVESVLQQSYPNWELCLHDDASTEKQTLDCLRHWQHQDSRIKVQYGDSNQHISGASNSALKIAIGQFIGLMDNDDELHVDALWHVIDTLNDDRDLDYIYTDEDKINPEGEFCEPHFKPDWSPELLESMMYVGHFGVIRRSVIDAVGGFRLGVEGSQDYDLTLRISQHTQRFAHIPRVLYHWRIIPGSVAGGGDAKSYAYTAAIKALTDYADKQPEPSKVTETELCGRYRIQRQSNNPDITIILPFHNKAEMTIDCLRSIGKSTYSNFKVLLISNNSEPAEYQRVADFSASLDYIELHQLNIPFNWSAINNWGVAQSTSEFVLFLNNDMTVINADWIEALMDCAVKEGVGAVGAKLLFEDNTVQHAGVVMGLGGIASHAFKHIDGDAPGYFGYAAVVRNCSAVTGACMLVRRSVVNQIEGFNEDLKVAYNDVDFCLRLREAKLKVLITPFAKLYHLESKTRPKFLDDMNSTQLAQFEAESAYIRERHAQYFSEGDPYYNKALSLRIENYSLRV
ncbi:MAG: GT2 family glycosyltransferase, partial [Paracoccaceae bacterium]